MEDNTAFYKNLMQKNRVAFHRKSRVIFSPHYEKCSRHNININITSTSTSKTSVGKGLGLGLVYSTYHISLCAHALIGIARDLFQKSSTPTLSLEPGAPLPWQNAPRTSGTFPTKTNAPITRQHSPYKPGSAPQRNLGPTKPRTSSTFATNPTTPETTTALIKMEAHAPMPRHHCQPQVREEAVAPSVVDYGPHKKLFPAQTKAHTPP